MDGGDLAVSNKRSRHTKVITGHQSRPTRGSPMKLCLIPEDRDGTRQAIRELS